MAATGKTPILLYGSTTATNTPIAGNLTNSSDGCEIAINVADKNLFFKDATNVVNTVPIRQSSASSNGWLSSTDWTTFNNKAAAFTYTSGYIPFGQGTTTPNQSTNLRYTTTGLSVNTGANASTVIDAKVSADTDLAGVFLRGYNDGTANGDRTAYITALSSAGNYNANLGLRGWNIIFNIAGTEKARINSTGNLAFANGNGIDFSATAGTGTSELLADYEEGTWTPVVTPDTGAFTTVTINNATYTKVGRLVTVFVKFTLTNSGTGAGLMTIAGLPYTVNSEYSSTQLIGRRVNDGLFMVGQLGSTSIQSFAKYDNTAAIVNGYLYTAIVSYIV